MRPNPIAMRYFETYYYANVVDEMLTDVEPFLVNLNNWHVDRKEELFVRPFSRWSVLHDLSYFVIEELFQERTRDIDMSELARDRTSRLWVEEAMRHHGQKVIPFRSWVKDAGIKPSKITEDHVHDYHQSLMESGELSALLEQLANEVFFLLFANRMLLAKLNHYISVAARHIDAPDISDEYRCCLEANGTIKRVALPEWVKRAVFFRDRGKCASCNSDLSGILTAQPDRHYDHIVPLAEYGINDVTNIQLLCATCNRGKGRRRLAISDRYEPWY